MQSCPTWRVWLPAARWALAGGDNFANIFDRKAKAFLQIALTAIGVDEFGRHEVDQRAEQAEIL